MNEVLFNRFPDRARHSSAKSDTAGPGSSPKRIAISASQNYMLADAGSGSRDPHLAAAINSKP